MATRSSILAWEIPQTEEPGNPLQYSCLGNPTDRRAWWATVRGVTRSQRRQASPALYSGSVRGVTRSQRRQAPPRLIFGFSHLWPTSKCPSAPHPRFLTHSALPLSFPNLLHLRCQQLLMTLHEG